MSARTGFLGPAAPSPGADRLAAADEATHGYVMNLTRLWAHSPEAKERLFEAMEAVAVSGALTMRQRGILVTATAREIGDSYCSLAWGGRLAQAADEATATAVLSGDDAGLNEQDRALAQWARKVASSPGRTTEQDVQELRDAGLTDAEVFAATAFVALRQAFSVINGALGAQPDAELVARLPEAVVRAVDWGRPPTVADPVT